MRLNGVALTGPRGCGGLHPPLGRFRDSRPPKSARIALLTRETLSNANLGKPRCGNKEAALQDDPVGEWLLGRLILPERFLPRDLNKRRAGCKNPPATETFRAYIFWARSNWKGKDYGRAAVWFRKAAMQGMRRRKSSLECSEKGQGINLDKSEAYVGC